MIESDREKIMNDELSGPKKVICGGSWFSRPRDLACVDFRYYDRPNYRFGSNGFRVMKAFSEPGAHRSALRVLRCGAWNLDQVNACAVDRFGYGPHGLGGSVGFRAMKREGEGNG